MAYRLGFFDTYRPYYGGATVTVYVAGTTTKANIYTDEALTVAAANPQVLESVTLGGITYGKWTTPLYTAQAVYLDIDGAVTGIIRPPITTLVAEDASDAVVTTTLGSRSRPFDDRFDDVIHALDYGQLGATAATNNTTLTAAINAAAANGGGRVLIPEGTYAFSGLTLSAGIVLEGEGRGITILQCQTAGDCVTLSGDRAGFANLTLDGVNKVASGIGVYSKANDETVFDDVDIKRFETGLHCKGGRRAAWRNLYLTANTDGAKLHGDLDTGGGSDGDEFRNNLWAGGLVSQNSGNGVQLSFVDKKCYHNTLADVGFEDNTGTGIDYNGCRYTRLPGCWWSGNTTNFAVGDDNDTTNADKNTIIGLYFEGGSMSGGAATFTETCQDVILDGVEIANVAFTLTLPLNPILVRNCTEDSLVTISGDGDKWTRWRDINMGEASGVTTGAAATKAWAYEPAPGEICHITAKILGNQRDGTDQAGYHVAAFFHRPGSTLAYDAQTANFTLGDTLTGGTSGATGRITADTDAGATGTLTLRDIVGEFQNNETITDGAGGSAKANGTLSHQNAALRGAVITMQAAYEDNVNTAGTLAVNATEVEAQVTGIAAETWEWTVHAEVVAG